MSEESRIIHLKTLGAAPRLERLNGREHLVVPVIALMEGVIHAVNSENAEYVTPEFLSSAAASWNGRPIVIGHPTKNGVQVSANEPGIWEERGCGTIFNSTVKGSRLGQEAWFDVARLEALNQHGLLKNIRAGEPVELSVGANVRTAANLGTFNGKPYRVSWLTGTGDHLAVLPNGRGACSLEMGCGTSRAAEASPTYEFEVEYQMADEKQSLRERLKALAAAFRATTVVDEQAASEEADDLVARYMEATEEQQAELRAAYGKTISAATMKQVQGAHDSAHAMHESTIALGAECSGMRVLESTTQPCGCKGETDMADKTMTKEEKAAAIKALTENEYSGFVAADLKFLEGMTDEQIARQAERAEQAKKLNADLKAAEAKTAADKALEEKAAKDKKAVDLKAAEQKPAELTEADFMKAAPAHLRVLIERTQAADAARKTELVGKLKTAAAPAYSEAELTALELPALEKLALVAKIDAPKADYSGRGLAARTDEKQEDFTPPDPYAAGLKAAGSKAVN